MLQAIVFYTSADQWQWFPSCHWCCQSAQHWGWCSQCLGCRDNSYLHPCYSSVCRNRLSSGCKGCPSSCESPRESWHIWPFVHPLPIPTLSLPMMCNTFSCDPTTQMRAHLYIFIGHTESAWLDILSSVRLNASSCCGKFCIISHVVASSV